MEFIKEFFEFLHTEGIALRHLDAIYEIARHNTHRLECRAFAEWYEANVFVDDED